VTDETLRRAVLFDIYGELLTEKQREYYDLHYNDDLSLSEIAEQTGISRQGVWDIIRRAQEAMEDMEKKTGLAQRFESRSKALEEIEAQLASLRDIPDEAAAVIKDAIGRLEGLRG
jgi:predicted DNA-binding protein YlxM (UPF0122 family)